MLEDLTILRVKWMVFIMVTEGRAVVSSWLLPANVRKLKEVIGEDS